MGTTNPNGETGVQPDEQKASDDRTDLLRGVLVNALGYLPKLAIPVLLILLVRAYGAESFGLYTFAQAVLLFVCRIVLLGMDKGLLWWAPQHSSKDTDPLHGFAETFTLAGVLTLLSTAVISSVLAPLFAKWGDTPDAELPLRIMSFGLVPMVLMELFLASTMALKKMEPNVLIKETLLPCVTITSALALAQISVDALGLAVAFVIGYSLSCITAYRWWRRLYPNHRTLIRFALPPKAFLRYSVPMWLSEMANSFQQRMDTYFVTAYLDLRLLGIYAAVVQIANAIRSIRRSFDPIVLVIAAEIGAKDAASRLRACYSYATYLVTATQLPALVFVLVFAQWLMPLFGDGFEAGTSAVILLCAFWVFNSPFSLAGIVVSAYGYSGLSLINVLIGIAAQAILLWLLVPKYLLLGAAGAVGLGYTVVSFVQLCQMRWVTKQWNYEPRVLFPATAGLFAVLFGYGVFLLSEDTLLQRSLAFGTFLLLYGAALYAQKSKPAT